MRRSLSMCYARGLRASMCICCIEHIVARFLFSPIRTTNVVRTSSCEYVQFLYGNGKWVPFISVCVFVCEPSFAHSFDGWSCCEHVERKESAQRDRKFYPKNNRVHCDVRLTFDTFRLYLCVCLTVSFISRHMACVCRQRDTNLGILHRKCRTI